MIHYLVLTDGCVIYEGYELDGVKRALRHFPNALITQSYQVRGSR